MQKENLKSEGTTETPGIILKKTAKGIKVGIERKCKQRGGSGKERGKLNRRDSERKRRRRKKIFKTRSVRKDKK